MMFLGMSASLSGQTSACLMPTAVNNIISIKLSNGIFNDLFVTEDTSSADVPISTVWDYSTLLHAKFDGNLLGGNVDFTLASVDHILTKVREYGSHEWINIFSNKVTDRDSLHFENFYKFCKARTIYQFALVPVMAGGIEGNYNVNTIKSEFEGLYILEKNDGYYTDLDNKISNRQRNKPYSIVETLNNKYPYATYPSKSCYDSYSISGGFYKLDEDIPNPEDSYVYRDQLMDFLSDGLPKVIKDYTGRVKLVAVKTDSIKESDTQYVEKFDTSFNVFEVGDMNKQEDLITNGLIDRLS